MAEHITKANSKSSYRIGAVANITGLSTHSIRAWERRYNLRLGQRSAGGTRSYTDQDVVLLSLLKALTDRGEAIGDVAHLPEHELRDRLKKHEAAQGEINDCAIPASLIDFEYFAKAIVLGEDLAEYLGCGAAAGDRWKTCWQFNTMDALWGGLSATSPDVLLTRLKTIEPNPTAFLDQWHQRAKNVLVIVFYEFNKSSTLTSMSDWGAKLIKWPVDVGSLSQLIPDYCMLHRLKQFQLNKGDTIIPRGSDSDSQRIFSDVQLMELKAMSSNIECECPNHLASILFELNAFEEYSQKCVGDNDSAALHSKLVKQIASARVSLEKMLLELCRHENLKI